jgi:hypothetical protein
MGFFVSEFRCLGSPRPPDFYTGLGLLLSFAALFGFSINLRIVRRIVRRLLPEPRRRQLAFDALELHIWDHTQKYEDQYLTRNHLVSTAQALEKRYRCPVITDKLICESLRLVALRVETRFKSAARDRRILLLNKLLVEIDASQPPLLSVALVDRLSAYIRSQPILAGLITAGVLLASFKLYSTASSTWLYVSVALLAAELLVVLAAARANRFLEQDPDGSRLHSGRLAWLVEPNKPNPVLDFFLLAMISRSKWAYSFWHLAWGPFWEHVFALTDPRKIELMHRFRFDAARGLARELRDLQRDRDMKAMDRTVSGKHDEDRFAILCRRLWVITGDESFREMERKGELLGAGQQGEVLRRL